MMGTPGPQLPGPAYRVKVGDVLTYNIYNALTTNNSNYTIQSRARIIGDDGVERTVGFPDTATTGVGSGNTFQGPVVATNPIQVNGWLIEWNWGIPGGTAGVPCNSIWVEAYISSDSVGNASWELVSRGPIGANITPAIGNFIQPTPDLWPEWVFQGTIVSDATVGTHKCTVNIAASPGGAFDIIGGQIIAQGSAAQNFTAYVTDGTNVIYTLFVATSAGTYSFPAAIAAAGGASAGAPLRVSGNMRLILEADTSTVSQTQTFSVALRIRPNRIPSVVLADNVGTPTLTTNTNQVF